MPKGGAVGGGALVFETGRFIVTEEGALPFKIKSKVGKGIVKQRP